MGWEFYGEGRFLGFFWDRDFFSVGGLDFSLVGDFFSRGVFYLGGGGPLPHFFLHKSSS